MEGDGERGRKERRERRKMNILIKGLEMKKGKGTESKGERVMERDKDTGGNRRNKRNKQEKKRRK